MINSNYNSTNPNIPNINVKNPLVDRPEKNNNILGIIPREKLDDCIDSQILINLQKKVKDLASEIWYKI